MTKLIYLCFAILILCNSYQGKSQGAIRENDLLFSKKNLLAWCIVPYDSKKRSSEERALMLKDLGFTSLAYDMREPDLANMETEFLTLKKYNIRLKGIWFWVDVEKDQVLNDANETILKTLTKTNTRTELWVSFPAKFFEGLTDDEKIQKAAKTIRYIHKRAAEIKCTIALYNHEDWFGEPANEVKIIEASGLKDVGIVYNFHHGHMQMDDFDNTLKITKPYLRAVNLNGMRGTEFNILTLGEGEREIELMKKLRTSGFNGSIGILGHTENEDVKLVLQRNLAGLKKILAEMEETKALKTYQ